MILTRIAKKQTIREIKSIEYAGRRIGSVAGSHIDSLVALKKAIVLCWKCRRKFSPKSASYKKPFRIPFVRSSRCDGCRELPAQAELFIHKDMNYL